MAITVIVHVMNADPFVAEIDELPDPNSAFIVCANPRGRDGKTLIFVEPEATRVIFPWHRISFVETMPSEEDQVKVETFYRD